MSSIPSDERTIETPSGPQTPSLSGLDTLATRADAAHSWEGAPPERVGPFRVLSVLGRGGMGVVYRAEQDSPRRVVALKLIRPGLVSGSLLRRFQLEAEILGRLQHPGIAHVHQAGLHDGAPYFAMEFIEGKNLSDHVRARAPGVRERLDLFVKVCEAVEHAHQKGIVHRDLKPANILVDKSGQPKILDFGVARATEGDVQTATMQTDVGMLVGTLPYMSPEQASGDPTLIDTRSDVYALGVILFELLAERLPHDLSNKMVHEAVRIIREDDPARLSSIHRSLRGDVETIVGKALEKDRDRRYQSASELAADVRRHLADEPITARPPSAAYQLSKFARRHRALVASASLAVLALAAGAVVAATQAVRATRAERAAQTRLAEAEATVGFLDRMLAAADPYAEGKDVPVRQVLDKSAASIAHDFADRPLVAARLHGTVGRTYLSLGVYDPAAEHLGRALDIRRREQGPADPETFRAQNDVATVLTKQGLYEEAEAAFNSAIAAESAALGRDHQVTLGAIDGLASLLAMQGRADEAEPLLRELLAAQTARAGAESTDAVSAMNSLAMTLTDLGRFDESIALYERAIEIQRRVGGPEHGLTLQLEGNFAQVLYWTCEADESLSEQARTARLERARDIGERLLETRVRMLGEDHHDTLNAMNNLATAYKALGLLDKAEPLFRRDVEASIRVLGPEHPDTLVSLSNMGNFLRTQGRCEEAIDYLDRAVAGSRRSLPPDFYGTGFTLGWQGSCLVELGRYEEAEAAFLEARGIIERSMGPDHPVAQQMALSLALLYDKWGRPEDAAAWRAKSPAPDPAPSPDPAEQG